VRRITDRIASTSSTAEFTAPARKKTGRTAAKKISRRYAGTSAKKRTRKRRARRLKGSAASVFLNIPYDAAFENLLLAYIAAISAFGFTPRATLEIPFNPRI